ncbi:MAG TPA: hypothetical protein VJS44_05830 [Pyrinomonadaceae bacterium]|nr:hypothetical protein [Pyrinomonadaceae bacterium]
MKILAAIAIAGLLVSVPLYRTLAEDCSCTSADGSCSASVSCPGGCIAFCPSKGCFARCSGATTAYYNERVSLQSKGGSSKQVSADLARATGKAISITPDNPDETYTFDFKKAVLWDVLEALSANGKVEVAGEDFEKLLRIRKALLTSERMSVCIHKASVRNIVDQLAALTGLPLRATSGNIDTQVTLSLKDVTLYDIVAQISEQASVQIEGAD